MNPPYRGTKGAYRRDANGSLSGKVNLQFRVKPETAAALRKFAADRQMPLGRAIDYVFTKLAAKIHSQPEPES